jgi:pimeloyl-ACP methyl ester carboxylesterase
MPSPRQPRVGRPHLERDRQQYALDWMIKETGRVQHFQPDGRGRLPRAVRSHAMISKHVGMAARRMERLAEAEAAAGHRETALDLYFRAALYFLDAQHVVFETNDEKRYLHSSLIRCYDRVRELAPYRIEHLDIPWNGQLVSGNLHLCPGDGPRPCVFYIPGCDQTKEAWPHPYFNQALQRGMHLFSFDGPGQGEGNLRGVKLTADNYEQAASAAIDYLLQRPEIDSERIGVHALSFGSHWGLRLAALDHRINAIVAPSASYCDKYYLMTEESPRYKQLFGYLTQSTTEQEVDQIAAAMSMEGYLERIQCPTLLIAGEFDPRSPIDEVYRLFDQIEAPAELWVFADQHHNASLGGDGAAVWQSDLHALACDWLRDRFDGKPLPHPGEVTYVDQASAGPNSPTVSRKRKWYE